MKFLKDNLLVLLIIAIIGAVVFLFIRRPSTTLVSNDGTEEYRLVTLLPRDGIPAIDNPIYYGVEEANREYAPSELVLGVSINGESRAYSTGKLNNHEIVNDVVGGEPIAVTW